MALSYKFTASDIVSCGRTTTDKIEEIKNWLTNSKECYVPKIMCEELIVLFLLCTSNDVQFTKTTILAHFKLKKDTPELHNQRNSEGDEIKGALKMWHISSLPVRTEENYAIHYFGLVEQDYKKFDQLAILKATLMLLDVTLGRASPPDGLIVITDLGEMGLKHLTKLKLNLMQKYFSFVQDGMLMKIRAMHIMNANAVVNKLFNILKIFIKSELFDKIYLHPPDVILDVFHEHLPKKCLPLEFGGDLPSIKKLSEDTEQQFKNRQEFWNKEEEWRKLYK